MFWVAFVASLGGLLFGFDTAVMSGVEQPMQKVYHLSDFSLGFTISIALFGTIVGALFCSKPTERYGRVKCLKVIAYLYMFSALGAALIVNWYSFLFFRFIGGIAVGASSVIGPMYIAEVSPPRWRGRFVAFFQFNIVFGMVIAYCTNFLLSGVPHDWQWMLGVMAIPALLFGILLITVPESPRWLVKERRDSEAREVLARLGDPDIDGQMDAIKDSLAAGGIKKERLFQKKYRKPIMLAFLVATFNQLSGINSILYYAPRIFEMSGVFHESAMVQSIIIGVTNLTFTMLGMALIDKLGRKTLLYIGSVGMVFSLAAVSYGFFTSHFQGCYMLVCLMCFIAFFAVSLGAVIWVLISEVFPNSVREKGQVLGSMTHWGWNAILQWVFPVFLGTGGGYIFSFFGVMMLLCLIFACKMPETKNKSLEQIQKELV